MMMLLTALIALTLSGIAILALGFGDPKRRRAAGEAGDAGMSVAQRRLLAALACLPGLGCAILGDAAAFMMWLGGCTLIGWSVAAGFRSSDKAA